MNHLKMLIYRIPKVLLMILLVLILSMPAVASDSNLAKTDLDNTFKKGFDFLVLTR